MGVYPRNRGFADILRQAFSADSGKVDSVMKYCQTVKNTNSDKNPWGYQPQLKSLPSDSNVSYRLARCSGGQVHLLWKSRASGSPVAGGSALSFGSRSGFAPFHEDCASFISLYV